MPLSNSGPLRLVAKIDKATRDAGLKKVMEDSPYSPLNRCRSTENP